MNVASVADVIRVRYAWLTVAGVAFVVCGSVSPFRFEAVPVGEVWGRFVGDLLLNAGVTSASDILANVLLMIPVAFCAAGAVLPTATGRRRLAAILGIVAAGAALSGSMEFVQTFLPARVVSLRDVASESAGTLIGVLVWLRVGPALTERLRQCLSARTRLSTVERCLLGYVAVLVVAKLMPFDLTLEPSALVHKYRAGRLVTGLALADPEAFARALLSWEATRAAVAYLPVGVAASLFWRQRGLRRPFPVAMTIGVLAVGVIECSHLFVESRSIDLHTVLAGAIGVAVGVLIARWKSAHTQAAPVPVWFGPALMGAGWAAALVWLQWYPFNFISDGSLAAARVHAMASWSSFAGGSSPGAIARTFIMALPLGVCMRRALGAGSCFGAGVITCVVAAVAGLWCGIEFGLALLPAAMPTLALVPVAMCGAAAGVWIGGVGAMQTAKVLS